MRLLRITLATIFQRKSWVVCAFLVLIFPFALPLISSATEKPLLEQPARVQAAWSMLWLCGLAWGLFTAAHEGEHNARSGLGEYFLTTGISRIRQLGQIWLALIAFIAPLTLAAALVCQFGARPANPIEQAWWWQLNLQHAILYLLVIAPLLMLAIALASRYGSTCGFALSLLLALYGLYGVAYLDNMLRVEENPLLQAVLWTSPQYRFADLTQRMYYKNGALSADTFKLLFAYFCGLGAVIFSLSGACFKSRAS
jgi:hypothetical protein